MGCDIIFAIDYSAGDSNDRLHSSGLPNHYQKRRANIAWQAKELRRRRNVGLAWGHVEYNEKLLDAAKRELEEELDISSHDLKLIAITDDLGENWHYVHAVFLLDNFSGKIKLNEPHKCSEWNFYSLDKLPLPIFPPHIKMIDSFVKEAIYLHD